MQTQFVVRLLDADDQLLSWARAVGESRPQESRAACPFFVMGLTRFVIERSGKIAKLVVHWTDLNLARVREHPELTPVEVGQVFDMAWAEPIWLVGGMENVPLPTVTEHVPVKLAVPTGNLMSVGHSPG